MSGAERRRPLDLAVAEAGLARLLTVPPVQEPTAQGPQRGARPELFGHALGCHAQQLPLTVIWTRAACGAPLEVVIGPAPSGAETSLLYPPGATGRGAGWADVRAQLSRLPAWVRCTGLPDPPIDDPEHDGRGTGTILEDYAAHLRDEPFAWLIIGEPVEPSDADGELAALRLALQSARPRVSGSEAARLEVERAEQRYRELSFGRGMGLWRVHVLAGAVDATQARRAGGLLCAASNFSDAPYLFKVVPPVSGFDEALRIDLEAPDGDRSPFLSTTASLTMLARPPLRELPGVRIVTPPRFDTTPEPPPRPPPLPDEFPSDLGEGVPFGYVLDEHGRPGQPLLLSHGSLNRHTFVCGATGSGKSQTVRTLLEGLSAAGVPWLVIEPAKAEYGGMAGRLGEKADVLVVRPGRADTIPGTLNPLEPSPGFALQTHVDFVRALFLAAFDAEEPFPQILSAALTRVYEQAGWDLVTGDPRPAWAGRGSSPRYPSLGDLREAAREVVGEIGYSERITADVLGFVDVRIGSLTYGSPGRFFQGGHPLDIAALLARHVVLELEGVASDTDKAFLIGAVLIRLFEELHTRHTATPKEERDRLRHVVVVEEAHRLLKHTDGDGAAAHAIELFAGLLAEIRAYGEGLIVAEQIPSKILPDVVKNTAIKVVHRLPAADDRAFVGAAMNLSDEQSEYVVTLPPGVAAVFTDGMDRPLLIAMPDHASRDGGVPVLKPPLQRARSAGCPARCDGADACTLRQIRHAEVLTEEEPRILLAAEVTAVAHVLGAWPVPSPRGEWVARLRTLDPRLLDCAAVHLAESVVDRRYTALASDYPPEHLIAHLGQLFRSWLLPDHAGPCGQEDDLRWAAGQARWRDVAQTLLEKANPTTGSDPDGQADPALLQRWHARGLDLPGGTWSSQLRVLAARIRPSEQVQRVLILGTRRRPSEPSALQSAADRCSEAGTPHDRLAAALSYVTDAEWLAPWLQTEDTKGQRQTVGSI